MLKINDKRSSSEVSWDENFCKHELTSEVSKDLEICIFCGQLWRYNEVMNAWVKSDMNRESRKRVLTIFQASRNYIQPLPFSEEEFETKSALSNPTLFV